MSVVEDRPRRADAVRNRARVVAAAAEVFAEAGLDASVPEIAARAGVGKATVYRSFPTKEHLVAAVLLERLAAFEAGVRAALEADDAWTALADLMVEKAGGMAGDQALAGGMSRVITLPEVAAAHASMWAALGALIERAKAQGGMRPDVTGEDLRVLWAGVCRVLAGEHETDPAAWRRYAALVLAALRADGVPAPRG
jgi:AcrR family transcriptional regulator